MTPDFARRLERERDEWKAKFIKQNKDLGCEMMDPAGTIWDYASGLQRENVQLKREVINWKTAHDIAIEQRDRLADHDNDSTTYTQIFGPELPSRRYTCEGCGEKWRKNNTVEGRTAPPICPSCHNDLMNFKRIEKMIPKIIHLKAKYPEL